MIEGMIYGLIGAWFLSLFGVDNIFVEALQPFVNFTLTFRIWICWYDF